MKTTEVVANRPLKMEEVYVIGMTAGLLTN